MSRSPSRRLLTPLIVCLLASVVVGALGCDDAPVSDPHRRCVAPAGMGSPQTIAEAVALMNALPEPITIACVVEALDRPLTLYATGSRVSAQPAAGPQDPRVFILSGDLLLSVVPAGEGQPLLELGQQVEPGWSLKGEVALPLPQPIAAAAPYDHLRYNADVTICGICHRDERRAEGIDHPNAYVSRALRPVAGEAASLAVLEGERARCDPALDATRCAILAALLDHGPVEWQALPADWQTIFGP